MPSNQIPEGEEEEEEEKEHRHTKSIPNPMMKY
jgi:hypothetical protein